MSRSLQRRVIQRAARAWANGRPHEAWETIHAADMDWFWPLFQRTCLTAARRRFERMMAG